MIIDGRVIAKKLELKLKEEVSSFGRPLRLDVILVGDDKASAQFVTIKEKFGQSIGIEVRRHEYEAEVSEGDLIDLITRLNNEEKTSGIIIQLPLPTHLNSEALVNLISPHKDVDALGKEARVLSPVVGAVQEILEQSQVSLENKKVVVLGQGKLVGRPIAVWLTQVGAKVETADKDTKNVPELLQTAEIIVTGIGQPHFIKPEMIKDGVVLIDAGTSDLPAGRQGRRGGLAGDADPSCAARCAVFTPVPGGVGPITVAKIFENLLALSS